MDEEELEKEWARYKYSVREKSEAIYSDIMNLLKQREQPDAVGFYLLIERDMDLPEDGISCYFV